MDHFELVARATSPENASRPPVYKAIGITLAICSGLFIGVSFVLKKVGLLKANVKYNEEAGEGYGYLKNFWWWSGMTLMIIGEIFVAYAFTDAILVTPMGALSVVVTTILSAIFLKERLSFVGKTGCFLCIVGSVVIVLNSPAQSSVATIQEMQAYVLSPGFLTYAAVIIVGCIFIALWAGPKYGKRSMLVYISICSLIGGLSVVATQGLGAAIITQIGGTAQFNQWFLYVLFVFVIATLVTEIIYLNKALNIFNAALVTPTYYVYFTSATIVTSAILFRGFKGTPIQITTIVLGFLTICSGVVLLQLSKSAKDVPDTAVFKGDLDQVRTIAEQEEHVSEPQADVIRGASGIVRAISKNRLRREAAEARRIHEERLEPIGENEAVEWDGLRRRKTIVRPGETPPPSRSKTQHFPLGLTHFPEDSDHDEDDGPHDNHHNIGLFTSIRRKAMSISTPHRAKSDRSISYASAEGDETVAPGKTPVQLHEMSTAHDSTPIRHVSNASSVPSYDGDLGTPGHVDTAYKSPGVHFAASSPSTHTQAEDSQFLHPQARSARRQFSFQNVFSRQRSGSAATTGTTTSDGRPGSSRSFLTERFGHKRGQTEEERIGLVHGDSVTGGRLETISSHVALPGTDGAAAGTEQSRDGGGAQEATRSTNALGRRRVGDAFDDSDFDERYDASPVDEDMGYQSQFRRSRDGFI